ncbi:MAG: SUF system NifU family Fe-S cluster assembly protein [Gemmatimonadaceae bacterium]
MGSLYGEVILEHYRRPTHRGPLADPHVTREVVNPLCGDRIRVELRLANGFVEAARFTGDACAICTAAASLSLGMAEGRAIAEAAPSDGEVLAALVVDVPQGRRACAILPLTALRACVDAASGGIHSTGRG